MNGKIQFAIDYRSALMFLIWRASDTALASEYDASEQSNASVSLAAADMFLVQWELTTYEVDQARDEWLKLLDAGALDPTEDRNPLDESIQRIVDYLKDDRQGQADLITQMAAIAFMDTRITDGEREFVWWFKDVFDLKTSEFEPLLERGGNLSIALDFYGSEYAKVRGTTRFRPVPET